ncbi:MAG: MFS transporter [Pseudomonadota bacterium]
MEWNKAGLFVSYESDGEHRVAKVSLNGRKKELTPKLGSTYYALPYTGGEWSVSESGAIAFTTASSVAPPDVGVSTSAGSTRTLTALNAMHLAGKELGTTFISSVGFHYYETMHQSLSLQWLPKATAPAIMGKIMAVGSFSQLATFGFVFAASAWFAMSFTNIFLVTGLVGFAATLLMWAVYPAFRDGVPQHKTLILRKRYWLYYALTFMGGARRQIFMVFAGFMMVEKFGFRLDHMALLAVANVFLLMIIAPMIGKWIVRFGERNILTFEYVGLALVFASYAFIESWELAVALYLIDHALFAMAIAMKTYFQKIADPADIAPTAGVAFTINHIAAVFIPVLFGLVWLWSPAAVFLAGSAMALISLALSRLVPTVPVPGNEVVLPRIATNA